MGLSDDQLTRDKFLNGKLLIWQPKIGYRAATDPVLLAAACPAEPGQSVLDLGCGVGTAGLCVAARVDIRLSGLEILPDYADLAGRNAAENGHDIDLHCGDLSAMPAELKVQSFDHVIMNPPFFGPGARAADTGRAFGRQQQTDLSQWIDAGLKRLHPGGLLTVIQMIDFLPEIIVALNGRAGGLEIKPLAPRAQKPATRFILRARKGSKSKARLASPLVLHAGDAHSKDADSYTAEAKSILRDGNSLQFW